MLSGLVHAEGLPVGRHLAAERARHPTVAHVPALYVIHHCVLHIRREVAVGTAVAASLGKSHHLGLNDGVNFLEVLPL